jgi:hypothetical protein
MTLTIVYSTRPQEEKKSSFIQHLQQTCGLKPVEILAYTNPGTQSLSKIYNHALNMATANPGMFMFLLKKIPSFKTGRILPPIKSLAFFYFKTVFRRSSRSILLIATLE